MINKEIVDIFAYGALNLEEDGEITPKARRMLDRFRNRLGISEKRTLELENYGK